MRFQKTLLVALASATFLAACGDDDDVGFVYSDDGRLTVMTRNLYLGADLAPVLAATTAQGFAAAGAQVFSLVNNQNAFTRRAGALADEIATARPDLVGLQEATRWNIQIPSDPATPATVPLYDFLEILLSELSARGVEYDVAVERALLDLEAPVAFSATSTVDIRITDRQVILAIRGLPTSNPRSATFDPSISLTVQPFGAPAPIPILRGWTAVDTTIAGQPIAFYNTHLEGFHPLANSAQAVALATVLGGESGRVVLVGDLNSDPTGAADGIPGFLGYPVMTGAPPTGAGFTDLWSNRNGSAPGFTCCFDPNLTVSAVTLDQRIDHILWRGALTPVSATLVGEDPADRTGSPPTWPSDHAGMVGVFTP